MTIRVDSFEYRCWHEVGHATVCLHLGGDVDFIEFLDGHALAHARTSAIVLPEIEKSVACGGFAAEFYLLKNGYAQQDPNDERDITEVKLHNAIWDRGDFWGLEPGQVGSFSDAQDREFMSHATKVVAPIFDNYFSAMQQLVRELCSARRVEGRRLRQLLLPFGVVMRNDIPLGRSK